MKQDYLSALDARNPFDELEPVSFKEKNPGLAVFHDESGDYNSSEWALTGLLWVRQSYVRSLANQLKSKRGNYTGELHFNKFANSFEGEYGARPQIAKEWLNIWRQQLKRNVWFNVLVVKKRELKNFPYDFHKYNRFTAMAIKGGLSLFFQHCPLLRLSIYSDAKSRPSIADGVTKDNFEQYLRQRIQNDTNDINYKGPPIKKLKIRCLTPKEGIFTPEEELLQLTDILLGGVSTAITPKATKKTKLWFGCQLAQLMQDGQKPIYQQIFDLSKGFSVSYFPDKYGRASKCGPIGILEH